MNGSFVRRGILVMVAPLVAVAIVCAGQTAQAAESAPAAKHGLTLLGELKYPRDFKKLDYVNADAAKGGTLRLFAIGSFDSFNAYNAKGVSAGGLGLITENLTASPPDEISAEYGLIAKSMEVAADLSHAVYSLRPEARFHDGTPVSADDVIWTVETLKEKGAAFYRFYYKNIARATKLGPHRVRFEFTGPPNRELPQIVGQLPVLSRNWWSTRDFAKTSLEPPLGSGPYRVKSFEAGRYVEYERVEDWWGADLPLNVGRFNFDIIRYEYYRDHTVALEAFKAGRYDVRQENISLVWATGYDFPARKEGKVKLETVAHGRSTGMQAFVFNLRRPQFRDPVLRRAMAYAFDFEWSNKNLFYGQYVRSKSFFSNSELAARGLPSEAELELLEPLRGSIPDEVFSSVYEPPATDGSGSIRGNLRTGLRLLKKNGYRIENGLLVSPITEKPVEFEFLLVSPAFERILAPFARNLKRLGIRASVRTIDQSQYINRLRSFNYDAIVGNFGQSLSPGNEQRNYWGSEAAERMGSRNYIGISDPAVDSLIEKIVNAGSRKQLVTASRALDRVLLWNFYVVPQWHSRTDRVAYWDRFGVPQHPAYGIDLMSWWTDAAKAAALDRSKSGTGEHPEGADQ